MASRMAMSAETSATVIRTRAKSSMRKNCRIAADYRRGLPRLGGECCRCGRRRGKPRLYGKLRRRVAGLFPLIAACMAGPPLLVYRDGNASVRRHVGDRLIQFLTADIERLATGTLRLLEISDAFNIDHCGNRLVQDFA